MKPAQAMLPLLLMLLFSCKKNDVTTNEPAAETIDNMQVSADFKFATTSNLSVQLTTLDNNDHPVPSVRINIYTDYPDNGGQMIMSCFTQSNGVYSGKLKLPAYADSVVIQTNAIGFVQLQKRKISNGQLTCTLGGKAPVEGGRGTNAPGGVGNKPSGTPLGNGRYIQPLGSYNALGVPSYLVSPNDVIDASFLTDINNALPESKPVPTYHPQYLLSDNQTDLQFQQAAQVWVTFVHEGAGYRNVLCFYKYNVNHPPVTAADIDTLYPIFPNTSFVNSGGGLVSGNKVEIGTFQPGTAVGWALIADGYNGSTITNGQATYYSQTSLNPETDVNLKKHCVLMNDVNRGKLLLAFEDLNRQNGSDNDFNDAIFYVSANPIQAINISNVILPAYSNTDSDHDGVTDNFDDFPQDPTRAFNNFYPSENTVGTLVFEDLWPSKGDYDFNDMVIDYNFNTVTNAQNKVVQINASITTKAIGASYHNGFGIQLPVSPDAIASITGTDIRGSLITNNSNGTEAGQSKATIIVFDDAYNELPWPGGGTGVNTTPGAPYVQPTTIHLTINLSSPVSVTALGLPPYNPFIFTNKSRATEVHLIDHEPTDLASPAFLGTESDNSNPASGRYYVTAKNLPFAIDIAGPFDYPVEKKVITETHLKFYQWGVSGGVQSPDWYKALPGYRNTTNIFTH